MARSKISQLRDNSLLGCDSESSDEKMVGKYIVMRTDRESTRATQTGAVASGQTCL